MSRTGPIFCYVRCPSCERVSAMAAGYLSLTLCQHCGAALPERRHVVTIARRLTLQGDRALIAPGASTSSPPGSGTSS
jgi:hypothetical protein